MESTGYRVPTNREVNRSLNSAEEALEETKREQKYNLTPEGKKIIDTTERLLDHTKQFVHEKNPNDTLNRLVRESQAFYDDVQSNRIKWMELHKILEDPKEKLDSDALIKRMDSIFKTSKLFAIELISSPSFRQTVMDFFSVLYTVLIDASHIEEIGKPLTEAYDRLNVDNKQAGEKLKEAGEKAVNVGLDLADPGKPITLTKEQRNMLWNRWKEVLNELSKRERAQRMFHGLFDLLNLLYRPFSDLTTKTEKTGEMIRNDKHINNMMVLSQQLFESFTRTSLEPILSHGKVLYTSISQDENLRNEIFAFQDWFLRTLERPECLAEERTFDEFNKHTDEINKIISAKKELRFNLMALRDEFNKSLWYIENDKLNLSIQNDIKELVQMIFLDSSGRITFKPEMLDQLKLIVLSSVVKRMRVPLPEIRADDPNSSFAFRVSGLVLGIQDVLPERIVAENRGVAVLNIKDKTIEKDLGKRAGYNAPVVDKAAEAIRIKMENMNIHMHNADIWFHKRTFPETESTGKADIDIGGNGMDLTFILRTDFGSDKLFTLASVDCEIHDLKLKLSNTIHDTLYNMIITLFKGTVKSNIEEAIQESMVGVFENLNVQIQRQVDNLRANMPDLPTLVKSIH